MRCVPLSLFPVHCQKMATVSCGRRSAAAGLWGAPPNCGERASSKSCIFRPRAWSSPFMVRSHRHGGNRQVFSRSPPRLQSAGAGARLWRYRQRSERNISVRSRQCPPMSTPQSAAAVGKATCPANRTGCLSTFATRQSHLVSLDVKRSALCVEVDINGERFTHHSPRRHRARAIACRVVVSWFAERGGSF